MNKLYVIAGLVLFGIVANFGMLYFFVFQARTDIRELENKLQQERIPAIPSIENRAIVPPSVPATMSGQATSCDNCRRDIDELRKAIALITPVPGTSFSSLPARTNGEVKEAFVPLSTGSTQANDWEDIPGMTATINTANYSKIKSTVFEIALRIPTANGTVYARLFNKTDKHPVWFSEVTSEGPLSTIKKATVTLDNGEKLYQVQMKNTLSALSVADSAYIKITLE